jgi:hypothetical protein
MSDHFLLWQERCLQNSNTKKQAEEMLEDFEEKEPVFAQLCAIRQSGPYHCEGPLVRDHMLRALMFLFAVQNREYSLAEVDEWNSKKHLQGFFQRLQEVVIKEKKFLIAYILAHDIGKKDTVREDEKGWHYYGHAQKGAESGYAGFREACLAFAGCAPSEAKLLRELIRVHMDINWEMSQKKETQILHVAKSVAERQGINLERFLSLLPAAFLLDVIGGSFEEHLSGFEKASLLVNYAEQEYVAFPYKKEDDVLRKHRKEKAEKKAILAEYGLGPEEWFLHLNTPHGKERGRVAQILEHFIAGVEDDEDVRYVGAGHAQELRMRSVRLREAKK